MAFVCSRKRLAGLVENVAFTLGRYYPLQSFVTGSYPASEDIRTTGDLLLAAEHDELPGSGQYPKMRVSDSTS
jgi:hypothetical protein